MQARPLAKGFWKLKYVYLKRMIKLTQVKIIISLRLPDKYKKFEMQKLSDVRRNNYSRHF